MPQFPFTPQALAAPSAVDQLMNGLVLARLRLLRAVSRSFVGNFEDFIIKEALNAANLATGRTALSETEAAPGSRHLMEAA